MVTDGEQERGIQAHGTRLVLQQRLLLMDVTGL